jgi:flagellar protein FliO/FliZ
VISESPIPSFPARARLRLGVILVLFVCSSAFAQTNPPASADEHRPILRSVDPTDPADSATNAKSTPAPSSGFDSAWVMFSLSGVIALIFLLKGISRHIMGGNGRFRSGNQAVQVLGRCFIAPRQQVLLLQVGRRIVVVGDSGGQLQALAQITESDEVAELIGRVKTQSAPLIKGNPFGSLFGRAKESFDSPEAEETPIAAPTPANTDIPANADDGLDSTRSAIRDLTARVRGIRERLEQ